jgi:hypothetical protein
MNGNALQAIDSMERQIGSADWSRWSKNRYMFYDYVRLSPTTVTEIDFFTVPQGGTDPYVAQLKTLEKTNMNESRSFGRVNFIITQIRTHIRLLPKNRQATAVAALNSVIYNEYGSTMRALDDLSNLGTLVMNIGQKEYFDIPQPFITCPPGFNPRIIQHGANTGGSVTCALWWQQDPDIDSVYNVRPEQLVEAGQTFNVKIVFDHTTTPALPIVTGSDVARVEIGVIFDGYIIRPIQ